VVTHWREHLGRYGETDAGRFQGRYGFLPVIINYYRSLHIPVAGGRYIADKTDKIADVPKLLAEVKRYHKLMESLDNMPIEDITGHVLKYVAEWRGQECQ